MTEATAATADLVDVERHLVERHRIGDPSAFAELYEQFGEMVFNLALRMSGQPEDAADLSQEIFLRIHRHLGKFHGRATLKTWVYRVSVNCCRSRLQSRVWWRKDRVSDADHLEQVADPARGPEDQAMARDAEEIVHGALQRLPAIFREAVVLRDLEGLTYEEIAAISGLRLGTVRSRIARGRERLRRLLESES